MSMLTVREVAAELSMSVTCVYQLVATGKLASHRIGVGRGAIRISEADLATFVDACRDEMLLKQKDWVAMAYAKGVPMGGDLPPKPSATQTPSFAIWAKSPFRERYRLP